MKKIILSTVLTLGDFSFSFAKSNVKTINSSKKNIKSEKKIKATCTRCVRSESTVVDSNGETVSSETIQYCYNVQC